MKTDVKQRMDALLAGGARLVVATYLEELIKDETAKVLQCSKDTFEQHKGGVQALDKLLQYVNRGGAQ